MHASDARQDLLTELDAIISDTARAKRLVQTNATLLEQVLEEFAKLLMYQRVTGIGVLLIHLEEASTARSDALH